MILRCEGLSHLYEGGSGRPALDRVDLTIRQGEVVALIGANGSGKTTLARHLNGLLAPTSGRVLFQGEEVSRIPARRRAAEIGFVFQNPDHQIFAPTVSDEVAFGPVHLGLAGEALQRRVGLALEVTELSGLEGRDPFTLTKGERQRLALASVLACEPSVLIMDEPTTGLDLPQQTAIMSLLDRLNERGHTIVIITHALWLLSDLVSRVVVMIEGRVAADGPPGAILPDVPLLRKAGLRPPDLARLASIGRVPLLSVEQWSEALVPEGAA